MQQRLLNIVRRAPEGLTCREIMDMLYANVSEPRTHNVVSVMVKHINRKIEPMGLQIRGSGGPGSIYRLLQVSPQ